MSPMWDRIDPLAEKYYGISPYAYCGGDPVNRGDYDGNSQVLIGAGIGFIIGAGFEMYNQRNKKSFDWSKILKKGGSGALSGAIASTGYGLVAKVTQGMGAGFLGNVIDQCIDNESVDLS